MAISDETYAAARARSDELRRAGHAVTAEYDSAREWLVLGLSNGVMIMIPLHLVEGLAGASAADLAEVEITRPDSACTFPGSTPTSTCRR